MNADNKIQQAVSCEQNSPNNQFVPDIEFIKKADVMKIFGVSRSSFDRWKNPKSEYYRPDFPKKIVLDGYILYVRSEIRAYMQNLMDNR